MRSASSDMVAHVVNLSTGLLLSNPSIGWELGENQPLRGYRLISLPLIFHMACPLLVVVPHHRHLGQTHPNREEFAIRLHSCDYAFT